MKIGALSIARDVERIDAVREVIGPDVKLLVDANNAYNRIDALRMGRELDRRDIFWFEEPLSPDDLEGCAELTRKLDTPIAIGENEYTRWGFKQLIDAHAAQILNADAQVLGGITEWKKVADLAMASHIMVAPHGDQEIHTHLVGAIPNGMIVEFYDNNTNGLLKSMFGNPLKLDGAGCITPPDTPGLGVDIQLDEMEQYRTYPTKATHPIGPLTLGEGIVSKKRSLTMGKKLVSVFCIMCLTVTLFAGGKAEVTPAVAEKIAGKLTIWSTLTQKERATEFDNLARAYEKANPDVTVEITLMPWSGALDKIMAAIMAGNAPDIMVTGTGYPANFGRHRRASGALRCGRKCWW